MEKCKVVKLRTCTQCTVQVQYCYALNPLLKRRRCTVHRLPLEPSTELNLEPNTELNHEWEAARRAGCKLDVSRVCLLELFFRDGRCGPATGRNSMPTWCHVCGTGPGRFSDRKKV